MMRTLFLLITLLLAQSALAEDIVNDPPSSLDAKMQLPKGAQEQMKAYQRLRQERLRKELEHEKKEPNSYDREDLYEQETRLKNHHHQHAERLLALEEGERDPQGVFLQATTQAFMERMAHQEENVPESKMLVPEDKPKRLVQKQAKPKIKKVTQRKRRLASKKRISRKKKRV